VRKTGKIQTNAKNTKNRSLQQINEVEAPEQMSKKFKKLLTSKENMSGQGKG
jgi:hypothetical protein